MNAALTIGAAALTASFVCGWGIRASLCDNAASRAEIAALQAEVAALRDVNAQHQRAASLAHAEAQRQKARADQTETAIEQIAQATGECIDAELPSDILSILDGLQ